MALKLKKWQRALIIIGCIIFVWGTIAVFPRTNNHGGENPYVWTQENSCMLIAHRGGRREMPENTLEAFYNACNIAANVMLETDVNMTADGRIIFCHDSRLDRTTNVTGNIIDWTYADLMAQEVDFGYANAERKDADGNVIRDEQGNVLYDLRKYTTGANAPVPNLEVTPHSVTYPSGITPRHDTKFLATTLEQALDAFPNQLFSVEIKQSGDTGKAALIKVLEILEEKDAFGRVVIGSFYEEIYEYEKQLKKSQYPDLMFSPATKGVLGILIPSWLLVDLFYFDQVSIMQVPMEQMGIKVATRAFVNTAHRHNIAVQFWTVNDADDMSYLIDIGADGIMTDYPSMLKNVLAAR